MRHDICDMAAVIPLSTPVHVKGIVTDKVLGVEGTPRSTTRTIRDSMGTLDKYVTRTWIFVYPICFTLAKLPLSSSSEIWRKRNNVIIAVSPPKHVYSQINFVHNHK